MNNATALAPKQSLTNRQAIFWGGLIAGTLDAVDGMIAYGTQDLNRRVAFISPRAYAEVIRLTSRVLGQVYPFSLTMIAGALPR